MSAVFKALADPTRRAILARLKEGQKTVGELAEPFDLSPSGFAKHLRVLERAGLMVQIKRGRDRLCRLKPKPLQQSISWLEQYQETWQRSAKSFANYAVKLETSKKGIPT